MEAYTITYEQLIAGSLLKFDTLDPLDIIILTALLGKDKINVLDGALTTIDKYIFNKNGKITLRKEYSLLSNITPNSNDSYYSIKQYFERITDDNLITWLNKLNIEDFVLRKIKLLNNVATSNIDNTFNTLEKEALTILLKKGDIYNFFNVQHQSYEIIIKQLGLAKLYIKDHSKEIQNFIQELNEIGYNCELLISFLETQDLTKNPYEILTIDNFINYCSLYYQSATTNTIKPINFTRLNTTKETILDEDGKKIMLKLLSIIDDYHAIHICHPNHIFTHSSINQKSHTISNINWNDINIDTMFKKGDYKSFITTENNRPFNYIHHRLAHEIMSSLPEENPEKIIKHLVVIEEYHLDDEAYYLVRGIIRGDIKGYSVAFNPEYEHTLPNNIWEKSLRLSGDEIPAIYRLKRKNNPENK